MALVGDDTVANCALRTALEPPEMLAIDLPGTAPWQARLRRRHVRLGVEPRAAISARHAVRLVCVLWAVPHLYDTAAACVTELVSNAVRHARWAESPDGCAIDLVLSLTGPYLLVEVRDPDSSLPVVGSPVDWSSVDWRAGERDGVGQSGLGLLTVMERVRECGGQFGTVVGERGKCVFFALPVAGFPAAGCAE
jgi:anti-sigma regulatory factor (Ser/Thr protein kinase)